MQEFFIQNVKVNEYNFIKNLEIPLSQDQRMHLIITGKNGSGKTTLLRGINEFLGELISGNYIKIYEMRDSINMFEAAIKELTLKNEELHQAIQEKKNLKNNADKATIQALDKDIRTYEENILYNKNKINLQKSAKDNYQNTVIKLQKIELDFSNSTTIYDEIKQGNFLLAFFEAKRENTPNVPTEIKNIDLKTTNSTDTKRLHKEFISYMVRLRNTMLNAKEDGNTAEAEKIHGWFDNFEKILQEIFAEPNLKLKYINDSLNFKITYKDREFGLNELSDGYSSLLAILTELILRMEARGIKAYKDMQGVVLIDEIETHLHIELQKKVLPFLCGIFPSIQFVVTTHSPFVLSSIQNATICDLQRKIITQDLSAYSYEAIVEAYFDSDKYSQIIKDKVCEFDKLANKKLTKNEINKHLDEFINFTRDISKFKALELETKLDEIKLKFLAQKDR